VQIVKNCHVRERSGALIAVGPIDPECIQRMSGKSGDKALICFPYAAFISLASVQPRAAKYIKTNTRLRSMESLLHRKISQSVSPGCMPIGGLMRQSLKACVVVSVIVIASACLMAGLAAHPQSQSAATDAGSLIQANTRNAVVMMRALASAQIAYRERVGNGDFGTEVDLFENNFIDVDFANALGCPRMISAKGKVCPGTGVPLRGYLYRLQATGSASNRIAGFSAVAVPAVTKDAMQTRACTFFVDQTQVIRASDDPTVEAGANSPALGSSRAPIVRDR
jgi:hypothetical protein